MNNVKIIDVKDAVGCVLCHDMTQIIKGVRKGPKFKKGHIVTEEDIPVLLSMGKEHIYILELDEFTYHENDAAIHLANICNGENLVQSGLSEGRINLIADCDGLLKIDIDLLNKINFCDDVMVATKYNNTIVKKGDIVAGTRAIPLFIAKDKIKICEDIAKENKILKVVPFKKQRVGILSTGSEVFKGLIKDGFKDVLIEKLSKFNFEIVEYRFATDETEHIHQNILEMLEMDLDLILCTSGMSVDPDDNTPGAISKASTEVVLYGTPVLPGSMFFHNILQLRVNLK
ncbi:MAG: molybdopterin-binding protein [Fusobacterium sp.]|nr:molybdopterin-binding protein [Fusobacterium sp.]